MTTEQLRTDIETALNRKLVTPKDFDFLRERIFARLHVLVSRTTLMRIWGYVNEGVEPSNSTLRILSQFLGYRDWEAYCQNALLPKEQQSSPVMSRRLSVTNELSRGERLRLTWQPQRVCDVEYLGELFQCSLIVEGEPLYLDNLRQGNRPPIAYVCGKKTGVWLDKDIDDSCRQKE